MEWRIFCILWLQNFISAKILLIVGVNWWKINQKSKVGAKASGLGFHLLNCYLRVI